MIIIFQFMFSFIVNGVDIWTIANTQPRKFDDVLMYTSDSMYGAADAKIRKFKVETLND